MIVSSYNHNSTSVAGECMGVSFVDDEGGKKGVFVHFQKFALCAG